MTDVQRVQPPNFGLVMKMEDRKRPSASDPDDAAPPAKRPALALNGSKGEATYDNAWDFMQQTLPEFQKDAILRQMREYKREKSYLENQLTDLEKRCTYHDDHLRIINAWFSQMIDELRVVVQNAPAPESPESSAFLSSLMFADNEKFEDHLSSRSAEIKTLVSALIGKMPPAAPEVRSVQEQLTKTLAAEKAHIMELQGLVSDKEQLAQRLESASYRYMVAEKKLDRAKSAVVAKMESMGMQPAKPTADDPKGTPVDEGTNGILESNENLDIVETAKKEAEAIAAKRKEQLEELEVENRKLTIDLTTINHRLTCLSDEDYAKTELFKTLKSQHEDVIKRINNLEAVNVQLREEAQQLQAERTKYRMQIDEESKVAVNEAESQLARAEADLSRIRNTRDELVSELAIQKASLGQHNLSVSESKELAMASESRVKALESEVERLRLRVGEITAQSDSAMDLSVEELKAKVATLERENSLLSTEVPSMEAAWKKAQSIAAKKVSDLAQTENDIAKLAAEKVKADQKYFTAMKAKEAREAEIRSLRLQNAKSSEIVAQLKEAESTSRSLIANLEGQASATREVLNTISTQERALQQQITEQTLLIESLNGQISTLKRTIETKDVAALDAAKVKRHLEVELEQARVRLSDTTRSLEDWKKKARGAESEEEVMLRRIAYCAVCSRNLKDTLIKPCGHVLCKDCVEERISSRSRKCPKCMKPFGLNDHQKIILDH
ncbi:BRE1-domain-containing protein [Eremomyces bilateralis CBS 781.70]|uniref:E3 ubiquitin protein ligase n=1 Tax=Eremomyces bilateralis CBS 781.70 TaxID=1392243 RepID=A0A6G1G6N9_9PEZI|nr:BRE1-domain-containing protein [Eremomyces bilateralis CBS 781.70]KAF1813550.1 BRE1-domain-containing protein [Eremomyces bilateralis CBS 781.70]